MNPATLARGLHTLRSCRHASFPQAGRTIWLSQPRTHAFSSTSTRFNSNNGRKPLTSRWVFYPTSAVILGAVCYATYQTSQPFRHTTLAVVRCSRVAVAAVGSVIDYKTMMLKSYASSAEEEEAWSACHTRSARRVLKALLANGGIFIKLGQHMASIVVLPIEWTSTMRILQDKCEPTDYEALGPLFEEEMGVAIDAYFDEFDPIPIGVASLAQVHIGREKKTGRLVAVKLQHPHLAEFCNVDMEMVDVTLGWVKSLFPEFELSWLGHEMRTNLPKEMDFKNEADNAARTTREFAHLRTSLYIPEVLFASKRILIMEYIQGGRVDDLEYLDKHKINRNKVAIELSKIFSQMVFVNGWFHADPHPGNLLIRPSPPGSKSSQPFEVVLLDHGLYFDLTPELRVNYSRLWLSLISPASPSVLETRRKYAEIVGNIGPDLYPVFEAALTGRIAMKGSWDESIDDAVPRASGMMELSRQTVEEKILIRKAVVEQEGLIVSVFDVLRRIPRRILMILKLNDLTRSLDNALMTTHSSIRVFLVSAKYCTWAVWEDDRSRLIDSIKQRGLLSFSLIFRYFSGWLHFQKSYLTLSLLETAMDFRGYLVGLRTPHTRHIL